jgi:hypothetical protein
MSSVFDVLKTRNVGELICSENVEQLAIVLNCFDSCLELCQIVELVTVAACNGSSSSLRLLLTQFSARLFSDDDSADKLLLYDALTQACRNLHSECVFLLLNAGVFRHEAPESERFERLLYLAMDQGCNYRDYWSDGWTEFSPTDHFMVYKQEHPLYREFREIDSIVGAYRQRLALNRVRKQHHTALLDIAVALCWLELPPYVLLEVIDWLAPLDGMSRKRKIDLLVGVHNSFQQIIKRHNK